MNKVALKIPGGKKLEKLLSHLEISHLCSKSGWLKILYCLSKQEQSVAVQVTLIFPTSVTWQKISISSKKMDFKSTDYSI